MNVYRELLPIIEKAQNTAAAHLKCSAQLKRHHEESDEEEFLDAIKKYIEHLLVVSYTVRSPCCERSIEFISDFVANQMGPPNQTNNQDDTDSSFVETEFQTKIFEFLLDKQNLDDRTVRFRACQIITMLFDRMIEKSLSVDMSDKLQDAMMERLSDSCLNVRLQAANSLYRLQDPVDPNNAVLRTYYEHLYCDSSSKMRKVCVEKIALTKATLKALVDRTRDVDASVRLAAYKRLCKSPLILAIHDKQTIILSVRQDSCTANVNFVMSTLIPQWLEKYDRKHLKFLTGLTLDSCTADLQRTNAVFQFVVKALYQTEPILELIAILNLDENRIPIEKLNWESMLYWRCLTELLREKATTDESYERILDEHLIPELINFLKFIEEYIERNIPLLSSEILRSPNAHPYSEQSPSDLHQYIVRQLFFMVAAYDFGDVVLCRLLKQLVGKSLRTYHLDSDVIHTMVDSLKHCMPQIKDRIVFICELISEIREPLMVDQGDVRMSNGVSTEENRVEEVAVNSQNDADKGVVPNPSVFNPGQDYSFAMAQLRVEMHQLSTLEESAIAKTEYLLANDYKLKKQNTLEKVKQLEAIMNTPVADIPEEADEHIPAGQVEDSQPTTTESVAVICQYLDIASALLSDAEVRRLCPHLEALYKAVLGPQLLHTVVAVRVRAFRCLSLCCIVNRELANVGIHMFCVMIQDYQPSEQSAIEPQLLSCCICSTSDLLVLFKTDLIQEPNKTAAPDAQDDQDEKDEDREEGRKQMAGSSVSLVVQGLVRIMENESGELQYDAVRALCNLVGNGRLHSSSVLLRLLILWCQPSSADEDEYSNYCKQYIGRLLERLKYLKCAPDLVQNAFLPTIRLLIGAPNTSPLSETNVNDVVKFLLELCLTLETNGTIHDNLAFSICTHLRTKPKSKYNPEFSKILLQLQLNSKTSAQDLMTICDHLKSDVADKFVLKNVYKFSSKLTFFLSKNGTLEGAQVEDDEESSDGDD